MSENQGQGAVSVVIIDRDPVTRTSIRNHLSEQGIRVAGEGENLASGISLVSGLRPQIVILELPGRAEKTLEAMQGLKDEFPQLGIIVIASDSSPQLILRSMRAGAQEFLTRPLDIREMGVAVQRLSGLMSRAVAAKKKSGKMVAVFSSKGGVGVSSVATNLSVSFARTGRKTVVVDLNLQMGDVGLMLDLRPEYTLADAIGTGVLDESRLSGLLVEHQSGVFLLAAPEDPVEAQKISPDHLLEIFSLLKGMFDYVVVDAGRTFDSRVLEILNLADTILVMSVLDVPTVRNVRRCLQLFKQLGYSDEKVKLLVNRKQKKTKVTVQDLEETSDKEVFWELPNDYKTLIAAIDAGEPAVMRSARSKLSKSFKELAEQLSELHFEGSEDEGASPENEDKEHKQRQSAGR